MIIKFFLDWIMACVYALKSAVSFKDAHSIYRGNDDFCD